MRRLLRDPLTYAVAGVLILLVVLGLTACGRTGRDTSGVKPGQPAAPKSGEIKTTPETTTPKTSKEAWANVEDLRAENALLMERIARAEAEAKRIEAQERRARLVLLARIVQWAAALAMLGGIVLTVISFVRPELKWIRRIAGIGALAAMVIFGLAGYLPDAAVWLGPIAAGLTVLGAGWLVWHLVRANGGLAATVRLVEEFKPHVNLPPDERVKMQRETIGKASAVVDATRANLGMP